MSGPERRQPCRQPHRLDQARRIRDPAAGDVERRAVIDRGPDDRQAQGDVHRPPEREQLDRDQPLIVITGDDGVELAPSSPERTACPAGNGPRTSMPRARAGRDCRAEHVVFLGAEQAVLSRMRVEPGHRQPRRRVPELRQLRGGQIEMSLGRARVSTTGTSRKRHVHGRQHHPQRLGVEHHRDARRAA